LTGELWGDPSAGGRNPVEAAGFGGRWRVVAKSNVTQILSAIEQGDLGATEKLLPLVIDDMDVSVRPMSIPDLKD
jgi:hypothetical protein